MARIPKTFTTNLDKIVYNKNGTYKHYERKGGVWKLSRTSVWDTNLYRMKKLL